jgi:hypothetical protein
MTYVNYPRMKKHNPYFSNIRRLANSCWSACAEQQKNANNSTLTPYRSRPSEILFRKRWRGEIHKELKQRLNRRRSEKWSNEDRVKCYKELVFNFLYSKYLHKINFSCVSKSLKLPQTFRTSLRPCKLFRLPSGHLPQTSKQLNTPKDEDVQRPSKETNANSF